ncbi:MAG: RecB family exonuclease [Candidatus Humimicrobiaceae bacterium]
MINKNNGLSQESFLQEPPLKKFNFSKLYTFQRCPFEYKYCYMDSCGNNYCSGVPNIGCGTILHHVLRDFFKNKSAEKRTLTDLLDLLNKNWASKDFVNKSIEKEWYEKSKDILIKFYAYTNPLANPILIEKRFKVNIDDVLLTGIIDRVDYSKEGYEIIDYKLENYMDNSYPDLQPIFYYFGAHSIFKIPPKKLTYIYLMDSCSESIYFEEIKEKSSLLTIKNIIKEIENTKDFIPRRNALCRGCVAKPICPEYK